MSDVTVTINERSYKVACDDGQEERLRRLGAIVDQRVGELVEAMGQIGEQRLLIMASLLLADELSDTRMELDEVRERISALEAQVQPRAAEAESLNSLATRLERIAEAMESA